MDIEVTTPLDTDADAVALKFDGEPAGASNWYEEIAVMTPDSDTEFEVNEVTNPFDIVDPKLIVFKFPIPDSKSSNKITSSSTIGGVPVGIFDDPLISIAEE